MKSRLKLKQITTIKSTNNADSDLIWIYKYSFSKGNTESGFFLLQFLFFIVLLSSFVFCLSFIFYASQSKDAFRLACATSAVELQKNITHAEKILFTMNPLSTTYRLQIKILQVALLAAPPPQKPAIITQLEKVYSQQNQLDLLQKKTIQNANLFIDFEYKKLISSTHNNNREIGLLWRQFLNIFFQVYSIQQPALAIRPDSIGGNGPNYEFDLQRIDHQSVVLKWQNIFTVKELTQKIFKPLAPQNERLKIKYGLICSVGIERTLSKWQLKINLDKF